MRMLFGTVLLSVLFVCGPSLAVAQGKRPAGKVSEDGGPRFDAARFLKDHDKNNDGKLTKDEVPEAMRAGFAEIDANHDGHLTRQELEQHSQHMSARRPTAVEMIWIVVDEPEHAVSLKELQEAYDMLRKLDKNKDGKISAADLKAFREKRVKHRLDLILKDLDHNHDGKISKSEARGLLHDDFSELDHNRDGYLDRQELHDCLNPQHKAAATTRTKRNTK